MGGSPWNPSVGLSTAPAEASLVVKHLSTDSCCSSMGSPQPMAGLAPPDVQGDRNDSRMGIKSELLNTVNLPVPSWPEGPSGFGSHNIVFESHESFGCSHSDSCDEASFDLEQFFLTNSLNQLDIVTSYQHPMSQEAGSSSNMDKAMGSEGTQVVSTPPSKRDQVAALSETQASNNSIQRVRSFQTFALMAEQAAMLGPEGSRGLFSGDEMPEADESPLDVLTHA